jgi:hypothetical protein
MGPSNRSCIATPKRRNVVNRLQLVIPTLFPTLVPTIGGHWGAAGGLAVREKPREQPMFADASNDRLACALAALLFAGLSVAAALHPVI